QDVFGHIAMAHSPLEKGEEIAAPFGERGQEVVAGGKVNWLLGLDAHETECRPRTDREASVTWSSIAAVHAARTRGLRRTSRSSPKTTSKAKRPNRRGRYSVPTSGQPRPCNASVERYSRRFAANSAVGMSCRRATSSSAAASRGYGRTSVESPVRWSPIWNSRKRWIASSAFAFAVVM